MNLIGKIPFALICLITAFQLELSAQTERFVEVTVEGSFAAYQPDDSSEGRKLVATRSFPLKCTFGPRTWSIECDGFIRNARELHVFDGTNVCRQLIVKEVVTKSEPENGQSKDTLRDQLKDTVFITIKPGDYPRSTMGVNVPWLAFCSSGYLKGSADAIPFVGRDIGFSLDAFGCSNKRVVFDDVLGLPREVSFHASDELYRKSLWNPYQTRNETLFSQRNNPRPVFADGVHVADYKVGSHTNYLGWNIPLSYSYEQYGQPRYPSEEPKIRSTVSGKVTGIREVKKLPEVFQDGKLQRVKDYRLRSDEVLLEYVTYSWNQSVVPALTDEVVKSARDIQVQRALLVKRTK